jgi:hypothetical protein
MEADAIDPEEMAPYLPPNPSNSKGEDSLDICEGKSILDRKQRDKLFQFSYKSNY